MRNELELMELVDRYLEGAMDATERAAFEQRLGSEPQLNAMLADQRHLREGLERLALRPAVAKAYRAHHLGKWKPWLGGAAIVVVAAAGWTVWERMPREAHKEPPIEQMGPLPVDPSTGAPADTTQRKMDHEVGTLIDTVYRVLQNGKWRTVKERPEGARVMVDSATTAVSEARPQQDALLTEEPILSSALVERKPDLPGGMDAFYRYLEASIKHPDLAKPVSGIVEVSFVISETGGVESAEVVKGLNAAYNAEALRVINAMPTWIPARQGGKPVKCRLQMPLQFRNPGVVVAPSLK